MTAEHASGGTWKTIQEIVASRPEGTEVGLSVYHFGSGQRLSLNGDVDFASASTIKILILAALARGFDEGRFSPSDEVAVRQDLKLTGSGVLNWLETGLKLSLRDHAWLMIAISDNTASNICIERVGIEAINALGNEIGVGKTCLGRMFMGANAPPGQPKNRSTADGLVAILKAIESNTAASAEQCAWMRSCLDDQ